MLRPLLNRATTKLMWQNFGLVLKYDVCCGLQGGKDNKTEGKHPSQSAALESYSC